MLSYAVKGGGGKNSYMQPDTPKTCLHRYMWPWPRYSHLTRLQNQLQHTKHCQMHNGLKAISLWTLLSSLSQSTSPGQALTWLDKTVASEFGPNFSNWFALSDFWRGCVVTIRQLPGPHQSSLNNIIDWVSDWLTRQDLRPIKWQKLNSKPKYLRSGCQRCGKLC